jgi:hypothetical protein
MNLKQREALEVLQSRLQSERNLNHPLPDAIENESHLFTEVDGVTVVIGLGGGYQIPAVRSYPETKTPGEKAIDAAVSARFWFDKQSKTAVDDGKGHVNPIVDADWRCGSGACPCRRQDRPKRKWRSLK